MDIQTATKDFEKWVSGHTEVVKSQLSDKHKELAESPVQFLRGTFYRWTQLFPEVCPELRKGLAVLSVGDLHIASFGTWRDGFGRLIWGVDDFDEAYPLPYANDLVRLAVSAVLDASEGEIKVGIGNVVDVILDGYRTCLREEASPLSLKKNTNGCARSRSTASISRRISLEEKMDMLCPHARCETFLRTHARRSPACCRPLSCHTGVVRRTQPESRSLGHPRYVAIADWQGGQIALEAKAAIPSACLWARPAAESRIYYQLALDQTIRCPDPFVRLSGKWLVRQLAPDSSPIEIETMSGQEDQDKLLHAMAWEAANVHLGTPARGSWRVVADPEQPPRQMAADGGQGYGGGDHRRLEGMEKIAILTILADTPLRKGISPIFPITSLLRIPLVALCRINMGRMSPLTNRHSSELLAQRKCETEPDTSCGCAKLRNEPETAPR